MGMVDARFRISVERKRNGVQEGHIGFSPLLVKFLFHGVELRCTSM